MNLKITFFILTLLAAPIFCHCGSCGTTEHKDTSYQKQINPTKKASPKFQMEMPKFSMPQNIDDEDQKLNLSEQQQKEYSLITADYEQKQFELTTKYCASIKAILSASDYNKFLAINPYCTQTTMFSF